MLHRLLARRFLGMMENSSSAAAKLPSVMSVSGGGARKVKVTMSVFPIVPEE